MPILLELYPPESNHLVDIAELERPEVFFYVARLERAGCWLWRFPEKRWLWRDQTPFRE